MAADRDDIVGSDPAVHPPITVGHDRAKVHQYIHVVQRMKISGVTDTKLRCSFSTTPMLLNTVATKSMPSYLSLAAAFV
jgi:hypothetical protein